MARLLALVGAGLIAPTSLDGDVLPRRPSRGGHAILRARRLHLVVG